MKIGICLIIKDENGYLEEWLNHHRKLGFNRFFIYDNVSSYDVYSFLCNSWTIKANDIIVHNWGDEKHGSQLRAYKDCCKRHQDKVDYIAFIDTDEFIMLKNHSTIQEYIEYYIEKYGEFDGLGMYWRMYGGNLTGNRIPVEDYKLYHENGHIKSILNPKKVIRFPDPHFATIIGNKYYDENHKILTAPIGIHTSNEIWIKHTWTRSYSEYLNKIQRQDVNRVKDRVLQEWQFQDYNNKCILSD